MGYANFGRRDADDNDGKSWHEEPRRIRPMRGQVIVREIKDEYATIRGVWRPPSNPRDIKIHRGRVLAMGAPMRTTSGAEVPYEFAVGDVVLFSFVSNEAKVATNVWEDGEKAVWLPQWVISAVVLP